MRTCGWSMCPPMCPCGRPATGLRSSGWLDVIRIGDKACREMGIENPRIAVAGLNPHSGEHGLFGQEEIQEIIPAIEAARAEGIRAEGPCAPGYRVLQSQGRLV